MKNSVVPDIRSSRLQQTAFLFLLLIVAAACSPRTATMLDTGDFSEANESAEEILELLPYQAEHYHSIEGRARAQVSGPDYSDQATVEFNSDRTQSLLGIRNNLGIEGGRILADQDSVLIYDRIEQMAWKMSISNARSAILSGFTAFNILEFLIPDINVNEVDQVFEDESTWMIIMNSGKQIFIDKNDHHITRITVPGIEPQAFNQFIFSSHASISGIMLPRRIQILSNDGKSNIFLTIRSLELNPSNLSFNINIPDEIAIERR